MNDFPLTYSGKFTMELPAISAIFPNLDEQGSSMGSKMGRAQLHG